MQKLIARTPILFESKLYGVGTELPTHNTAMNEAWIKAGTAKWVDDEAVSTEKTVSVKAKPKTAEPGLPGMAVASESETGEDLVGKVPKTKARSKK